MKLLSAALLMTLLFFGGCEQTESTKAEKEAVKKDTINPRQGKGEGEVGEGVYGR